MKFGAIGADLIASPQLLGGRVKGFTFSLKP
jgi:hypothetical protein